MGLNPTEWAKPVGGNVLCVGSLILEAVSPTATPHSTHAGVISTNALSCPPSAGTFQTPFLITTPPSFWPQRSRT